MHLLCLFRTVVERQVTLQVVEQYLDSIKVSAALAVVQLVP